MVEDTIKEKKGKGGYLEKYTFFDWEPVKLSNKTIHNTA